MLSKAWMGKCSNHPTPQPYFFALTHMAITSICISTPMGLPLLLEHGFLSPFLYLLEITIILYHGPFQRWSSSRFAINWTRSMPGARQSSPGNSPDQPQLTSRLHRQFDVLSSSHTWNSSTKLMATSIVTLCSLRLLFLTPQYLYLPSLLFFSFFPRDSQSFSTLCQWGELSR